MNEIIRKYKEKFIYFWKQLEKKQKILLTSSVALILFALILVTFMSTRINYVPTFVNLNEKTAGNIIAKLDEIGVTYEIGGGGTVISVPEAEADKLKINIAQDLEYGNFYSRFWDSATYGITDAELSILERDAIEQELRALIVNGINGISKAEVMLTLPKDKVFYSEEDQKATASVILNVDPGVNLSASQIKNIYYLISRSVPSLPIENITLSDQYGEPLVYSESGQSSTSSTYDQQRNIELNFQQDLRKDIENMLNSIYGQENISVNVFAKMNFDQKRTVENLVESVVDGEGIPISTERIQESSTNGENSGNIEGTGETQIPTYQSNTGTESTYEYVEERINYDVNEITNEIVSSPYRLEDLSITIAVNMDAANEQTQKVTTDITNLILPIVSAALGPNEDASMVNISSKIAIIAQEFTEPIAYFDDDKDSLSTLLLYGLAGLSVLAIGGAGFSIVRKNNKRKEDKLMNLSVEDFAKPEYDFAPAMTGENVLEREIQKFSSKKPDEFTKLIRTWLYEE
ncbi:MAG: flagellar basal-body MS-ring/collar protein FliF [Vulcanibacillus sp.]